jgi:hypothetical protein
LCEFRSTFAGGGRRGGDRPGSSSHLFVEFDPVALEDVGAGDDNVNLSGATLDCVFNLLEALSA